MFRKFSRRISVVALSRLKHDLSNTSRDGSSSSSAEPGEKHSTATGAAGPSSSSHHEEHPTANSLGSKEGPNSGNGNSDPLFVAMKEGNFADLQNHATAYFQRRWKEEYNLPAGLVIIALVVWYWIAWTERSIKRKCAAMEATAEKEVQDTLNMVQKMVEHYKSEMLKASTDMKLNMAKNAELIAEIDRLTAALRSCQVRPPSS